MRRQLLVHVGEAQNQKITGVENFTTYYIPYFGVIESLAVHYIRPRGKHKKLVKRREKGIRRNQMA